MIPPFDAEGDLPQGMHQTAWAAFRERFCIFVRSERRLRLCRQIEQMLGEAQASYIVERITHRSPKFGGKSEIALSSGDGCDTDYHHGARRRHSVAP